MWKDLTMQQRAELMDIYLGHGITSLDDMRRDYDLRSSDTANTYREGGSIHISPSKKGTFTAAATKHGMGVQEFASKVLAHPENYSPAMRKKANFARNASKWHGLGGNLYDDGGDLGERPPIVPFTQKEEVIITPDSEYNRYLNTLPDNQRFTPNNEYDSYLYWKLNGKPKDFKEAYNKGMFNYDHSDNGYHANSIAWGEDGVGYFMKPKTHRTVHMETDWFNKGLVTEEGGWQRPETFLEWKDSKGFRDNYDLVDDPNRPNFYKYQPKKKALGGNLYDLGGDKEGNPYDKPQTFAGRIVQFAGGSPKTVRGADVGSSLLQMVPQLGPFASALDFGYDLNRAVHSEKGALADSGLDLLGMLPFLSKAGLKVGKGVIDRIKGSPNLRAAWNSLVGTFKAGDFINDTYGANATSDAYYDAKQKALGGHIYDGLTEGSQQMQTGGVQQGRTSADDTVLTITVDGIPYNITPSAFDAKFDLKMRDSEGNPREMTPELKAKIFEGIADAKNNKAVLDAQGSLEYGNQNTAELLPYEPVDNTNIPAVIGRGIGKYSDEFKWRLGNDPGSIALQGKYTMPAIAAASLLGGKTAEMMTRYGMEGLLPAAKEWALNTFRPGSSFWMSPIIQGTARAGLVNAGTSLLTGRDTFGQLLGDSVEGTFGWNPNSWKPFGLPVGEFVTEAFNPGWYNTTAKVFDSALGKAGNFAENTVDNALNWRPWVPRDKNSYYRITSKEAIEDAIDRGSMLSSRKAYEVNPEYRNFVDDNSLLGVKLYDYQMFGKGKPWEGSTANQTKGKPYIIKSTGEPNGLVWQQSNVDGFSHHGHDGIYRPVYFGDMEQIPTQGFEYWKPNFFGYTRKQFPIGQDPYYNYMGKGYPVDRSGLGESDLGVIGNRFGEYIGSGEEQAVFNDAEDPNSVLKVMDFYRKNMPQLKDWVSTYSAQRNAVPLQEPIKFVGIVDNEGYPFPVFSQTKMSPLGHMSTDRFNREYLPQLQKELLPLGYSREKTGSDFTNGIYTLTDIKPENVGFTPEGKIGFFDVSRIGGQSTVGNTATRNASLAVNEGLGNNIERGSNYWKSIADATLASPEGLRIDTPWGLKDFQLYKGVYDEEIPESLKQIYRNSVAPRLEKARSDYYPLQASVKEGVEKALSKDYTVYPKEVFDDANLNSTAGLTHSNGHIAIKEGQADFALGHEVRHRVQGHIVRNERESELLHNAYGSEFKNLREEYPKFKDTDMDAEMETLNYDARSALLGDNVLKEYDVEVQNSIIDEMSDADVFSAVADANGYGQAFIDLLKKQNKLTPERAQQIREAMKEVGSLAIPTAIAAGTLYGKQE